MVILRDKVGNNSWQRYAKGGVQKQQEKDEPLGASSRCSTSRQLQIHYQPRGTQNCIQDGRKLVFRKWQNASQLSGTAYSDLSIHTKHKEDKPSTCVATIRAATIYGSIQSHVNATHRWSNYHRSRKDNKQSKSEEQLWKWLTNRSKNHLTSPRRLHDGWEYQVPWERAPHLEVSQSWLEISVIQYLSISC